jgi:hypothetical protein
MRNTRNSSRAWTFGSIILGVAALAFVFTTVFSSTDAAATSASTNDSEMGPNPEPPTQTSAMNATADSATADTVAVTLSEETIEIPETIDTGEIVFKVTNDSQAAHGFAIGSDLSAPAEVARLDESLNAGQSETLSANLKPGTYMAYYPVQNDTGQADQDQSAQVSTQFTAEDSSASSK